MVDKINLSLDDIIKINKKTKKPTRGRGTGRRGRGGRGARGGSRGRGNSRGVSRGGISKSQSRRGGGRGRGRGRQQGSFARSKSAPSGKWDHDMFNPVKQGLRSAGSLNRGGSGKLLLSNLEFGVSDSDLNELFSEFGALRRAAVHYDRSGRSLGSADVFFERRSDAARALQQYNGVPLDGRAMQIRFVDGDTTITSQKPVSFNNGRTQRGSARGSSRGRGRGRGGGRGRGRGRGGGRGGGQQKKPVSLEELDKQLDEYIAKND